MLCVGLSCPVGVRNLGRSVGTEDKQELGKDIQLAVRKCCQEKDTSPTSLCTLLTDFLFLLNVLCEKHYGEYKGTGDVVSAHEELTRQLERQWHKPLKR